MMQKSDINDIIRLKVHLSVLHKMYLGRRDHNDPLRAARRVNNTCELFGSNTGLSLHRRLSSTEEFVLLVARICWGGKWSYVE